MDGLKKKNIFSEQGWLAVYPLLISLSFLSSFWGCLSSFEFLFVIHYKVSNLAMQLPKPIK